MSIYDVVTINGKTQILKNGQRLKGSGKVVTDDGIYYHKEGLLHNTEGPAVVLQETNKVEAFYIEGELLTKDDYIKIV